MTAGRRWAAPLALACLLTAGSAGATRETAAAPAAGARPDILFVIMDDVGVDQLRTFGFGGADPASVPNLDRIAAAGVRFTQTWAMPECSPSRAAFFTGRYTLRTGVTSAIIDNHLPQTYVSPFETTIPRVLERAGYASAIIGKYHLGSGNDPAGDCAPATRGWDFFTGNMEAGPPSIDLTAGGLSEGGDLACGFDTGAGAGACYVLDGSGGTACERIAPRGAGVTSTPARACLERGGIFRPGLACGRDAPTLADFAVPNAYYAWSRTTTEGRRPPLARDRCEGPEASRTYMTTAQTDDAVRWWRGRAGGPRMLTVSYNAIHTPYQPPPAGLAGGSSARAPRCDGPLSPRRLGNLMLEAMDREIGRLLEGLGLATLGSDGRRIARLTLGNTVLVVVGDNGSFGPTVKAASDFDPFRSKATVYETGVRVPLIVAGPVVRRPGRSVDHIVNVVDLFGLFADVAGVDARAAVPASHPLDSEPLLPYLAQPSREAIRQTSFTQLAVGTLSPDPEERSWPCLLANNSCSDTLFPTQKFCQDNGGTWFGPGGRQRASSCCAVLAGLPGPGAIAPAAQFAVRDARFKLVELDQQNCSAPLPAGAPADEKPFPWAEYATRTSTELYDLRAAASANPAGIERPDADLLKDCPDGADPAGCLRGPARAAFAGLSAALRSLKGSADAQNECARKGDGNLDLRVDAADVAGWRAFRGLGPSRYDIDVDGATDEADLAAIQANLGAACGADG